MNKQQADYLARRTCYILDANNDFENDLAAHGIPKKHLNKIKTAFDLIFQVNQEAVEIRNKK